MGSTFAEAPAPATRGLTKAQRDALQAILQSGPSCFRPTSHGREQAFVGQLFSMGLIERLNRMRPGPAVYEITAAGRAALLKL